MPKLVEYQTESGTAPFAQWFDSLGTKEALKVRTALAQMEAGNFGDHKSVGGGVWERRIHFGKGYRVYFAREGGDTVVLLWGGTKNRQQSDIDRAKRWWGEYKKRKKQTVSGPESKRSRRRSQRSKGEK